MLSHSQSDEIVVDAADLASSKEKRTIRVLHVDDDPSLQEISKQILMDTDDSFGIDHACCVDEAPTKLALNNYDLIISDYKMPKKAGFQFLKELREGKQDHPNGVAKLSGELQYITCYMCIGCLGGET